MSNATGELARKVAMTACTGPDCCRGNSPLVDVDWLGFIGEMTVGSKGYTPVAANAALTVSGLNGKRAGGL